MAITCCAHCLNPTRLSDYVAVIGDPNGPYHYHAQNDDCLREAARYYSALGGSAVGIDGPRYYVSRCLAFLSASAMSS